VSEQAHSVEAEVMANGFEIGDVRCEIELRGLRHQRRAPPAALVVEDDLVRFRQTFQIGRKVAVVEPGATVNYDQGIACTGRAIEDLDTVAAGDVPRGGRQRCRAAGACDQRDQRRDNEDALSDRASRRERDSQHSAILPAI
jgi:MoxR-like ATPase